jgi:hypothetical protein
MTVQHELDETKIVPLVAELHETHDLVGIDTAGAASQDDLRDWLRRLGAGPHRALKR